MKTTTWICLLLALLVLPTALPAEEPAARTLVVDFGKELGQVSPRTGFLGGIRDAMPDAIIQPLHPSLFRIGHQFRGRLSGGLTAAIDRVEDLGARYKLVMSDLINSKPKDWSIYEADVKKLVTQVGPRAARIIWEPVNEPDISHKPIDTYYEVYAHAFKALRPAEPQAEICGPSFAYPSFEKYRQFLDYCRQNQLECNYLAWHYTGWEADRPEQAKWQLGRLRQFIDQYPEQKIREIHCDEWGAGPDKPGRLHPGRAVIWFYYLESMYQVDRACRANWGREDEYLGGILTSKFEPHPVYHVYRMYGSTKDQVRVAAQGNGKTLACLASKSADRREILLGSIEKTPQPVTVELRNLGIVDYTLHVRLVPATDLDGVLLAEQLPQATDYRLTRLPDGARITLQKVEENQAYHLLLVK